MDISNKAPQTYLENLDMVNSATQFISSQNNNNLLLNTNSNFISNNNNKMANTNYNYNSFIKTQNDNSTNIPSTSRKESFFNNRNKVNDLKYNKFNTFSTLNNNKRFAWKEIMNENNNILNEGNDLESPIIENILNSNINEKEIQNIPENYLVNLIQTLQGVAQKAIENKNELFLENQKLYKDLSTIKNNYNNVIQSNNKMNKALLTLNKQNNYQKNLIKNYENNIKDKNDFYNFEELNLDKYLQSNNKYKQKYYCKLCANKKFKNQQYLEGHIKRRHLDYYQQFLKRNNKKEKSNQEIYNKKLNDMKDNFESLINQLIKKNHYTRINEKLNGLEKLLLMSKFQDDNFIINDNIYYNINTDNYIQENNLLYDENIQDINNNNINKININKINEINNKEIETINEEEDDEYKKKEKEIILKEINNFKKKLFQFKRKYTKEIVELNYEKKFQRIKKYFENNSEDEIINDNPSHTRRQNKVKTIKEKNKSKLLESQFGFDQSPNINNDDIKTSKHVEGFLSNKNTIEKIDLKRKNKNEFDNKNNNENILNNSNNNKEEEYNNNSEKSIEEKIKFKNEKEILFSESDNNNNSNGELTEEKNMKNFYKNFRNRDAKFSKGNKIDYLKRLIPDDYKINNDKIDNEIDKKINEKLNYIDNHKKINLIEYTLKLYYEILDKNTIFGVVHLFYSRNINKLMNITKLIDNVNNLYYQSVEFREMKSYQLRSKGQNLFETINYNIDGDDQYMNEENEESEKINFSFGKN